MAITEHEYEPVPGLPGRLPAGEEILWQGAPRWEALARRAFHVRTVAGYFLILLALHFAWQIQSGKALAAALGESLVFLFPGAIAVGILTFLAYSMARATLYTITDRRVVMRFGVAVEMTVNFPFAKIEGAALKQYPDGTGDIPIALDPSAKVAYLLLWPHARPWHFSPAEPMLRCIPDAAEPARILGEALESSAAAKGHREALETPPEASAEPTDRGPSGE